MAQSGFTPISLYYSSTASAAPTSGNLVAGELAINTADGKLFYKDSAGVVQTLATKDTAAGTFTSISDSGNLTFTGTGNRITGDFSNATLANRVAIQSSTTNGTTFVNVIPNGTATQSNLMLWTDPAFTNYALLNIRQTNTETAFQALAGGSVSSTPMTFATGGSERLRIDTSGNVGIGTSSPQNRLTIQDTNAGSPVAGLIIRNGDATNFHRIGIGYNSGTASGYVPQNAVYIDGYKGGGYGNLGGLAIGTSTNAPVIFGANSAEAMRIDSSGNLLVGGTANASVAGSACKTIIYDTFASKFGLGFNNTQTTGTAYLVQFAYNGVQVGQITSNSTNTTYSTSSDYRLKENIAPMTGALSVVQQLKPVTYTWKADGSDGQGFIAHELQSVMPDAVVGEKDDVNEDGSVKPQGIDTSFLVATLTAAIQEQQVMIEELSASYDALKAKVAALEAA